MSCRPRHCHVDSTEFLEALSSGLGQAWRYVVEVAIEAYQHSILTRGVGGNDRIGAVGRKLFGKSSDFVASRFKEFADGFRHTVVSKELNRLEVAAQAANGCVRRAACTSLEVSDGYSSIMAWSE